MEIEQKSAGGVAIRFLSGPLVEKTISIQKPETIIGRDPQSDIIVFDPRVSRRHACISMVNGSWSIENLSQSSFITINQQQVQHGILQNNNVVGLGENTSFV
ncbi:MAG TPA: FHA domain-containing protein, partial [Ktedonobacteraceae bacterium]|nr:FHA domain-containing protein [Ktedonobacteraceae bacterium]